MTRLAPLAVGLLALWLVCFAAGCDSQGPEDASTWALIQDEILTPHCTKACHEPGAAFAAQSGLVLTPARAYDELVGVPPKNAAARADGLVRVATGGLPGLYKSFLWEKVNAPDQEHFYEDHPAYGSLMPLGAPPLTNGQLELLRRWIVAGAPRTGVVAEASLLADTARYAPSVVFEPLPLPANGLAYRLGPFDVAPHYEREFLYYAPPQHTGDVLVNRIEVSMRPGSHHFLLYTFDESLPAALNPTPNTYRDLRRADGSYQLPHLLQMGYHVFFGGTQWPRLDYRFPEGVALRLPAGKGFDLNAHYVNRTAAPRQGEVHVNLHLADPAQVRHTAQVLALNNTNFELPPRRTTTINKTYKFDRRVHIFQLFSHAHEHMTEFRVQVVGGPRAGETVYVAYDWEHPPLLQIDPPLVLEAGQGLQLSATYNNWTDRTLRFGLLSEDEMMILFGYFY